MLVNSILTDHLKAQGLPVRLLPDREVSSYSWSELMSVHPSAQETVAKLLGYPYSGSLDAFSEAYTPSLSPSAGETDYDYDRWLEGYVEHSYFPARVGTTILADRSTSSVVWITSNPFSSMLDSQPASNIVMASPEVINGILRGTRNESSVVAPHSDTESIDVWINKLITAAYNQGAADVELTSHISSIKVRFKIMGEWSDWVSSLPLVHRGPLLRSLCASASPAIDYEAGTDHDFKLEKRIQGSDTSWRGSITPAALGDSITLRMLPGIGRVPLLEELGYNEQACKLMRVAKKRRDGLILVTGATGHGKTTTLYSLMTEIRDDNRKVFSVENPIELVIPGTIQKSVMDASNIDEKYRVTFASAIRTGLRHAPDVMVVGETRDSETAIAAVGASRTGHLTYSTLHTSNVRISIKRMLDLGIDAMSLADTLTLVVSQNLVRKLCPHCRIEHADGTCSRNHEGCSQCSNRGYIGRTVVYEMAALDDESREAIIDGSLDRHFPRLEKLGMYIGKRSIAESLWKSGMVDRKDVEEFFSV
jgi:type II secretory ATPase GspE/PulE/Tfp pilus assembly ATPase PilB-like protein